MADDSESHIQYLQTPRMVNMPDLNVLQRATLESEVATLKAKLVEANSQNRRVKKNRHFNKKLKRILRKKRVQENRYTKPFNQYSKEATSTIVDDSNYSPFMLGIMGKRNELIVKKNEELMNQISLKYGYIKDWIESSAKQGKCILPIIFDKADLYTNCPGLGTPIEVLKRWLKQITENTHYLFGIKYSILFIDNRKCRYMKPYFLVNFMWS